MMPAPHGSTGSPETAAGARLSGSGRWLLAFLVALASLPYLNILFNGFVYDDDLQVLRNPYVRNFGHLKQIFTTTVWSFQGGAQGITNYYRPVMTLTYALCHALFGFSAAGFHLASIAIHVAVVCLMFAVASRIFKDRAVAFLAAALFALHPIHTEAVDWIAAVTDLEAAFFFLLAFWFFLGLRETGGKRWAVLQAAMLASYLLAVLSKESAAVLPVIAVIYEHSCREDRQDASFLVKLRRYGGLWLALAAYLAARIHFLGAFAPIAARRGLSFNAIVLSAVALTGHYIEKLFWPVRLCAAYVFPATLGALLPRIFAGLAVTVICVLLMVYFWKRERRVFFGLIWFFVTLAPVLNVGWMPDFAFAERYLYLPSVGFCWVLGWLGLKFWRKCVAEGVAWKRAAATFACVLAVLMITRIMIRGRDWKNDLTFYQSTLSVSPNALMIRNDLGNYYWDHGDFADAGEQWEKAYQLQPSATYVLDNLGLLRLRQKRYEEAVIFFERTLSVTPKDEGAHTGLGMAYSAMGMKQKAEQELLAAIKLAPLDVRPRVNLGELYFDEGRYAEACAQFQASNRSMPTTRASYGLGLAEWMRGDRTSAESAFKTALQIDPAGARPHFMLGLFYGATGRLAEAIREYQAGLQRDPGDQKALAALAKLQGQAASAEAGRR
ncbi:MAG TPA: tetratricopeptide repeat protein [Terriglobia bacterium]|nr:tetratricopeptide repeat protein [Terriglobia bacterium]